MKALNDFHAKQLFCSHAFMQFDPDQEFEGLVQDAMNVCKRLPLSLKVLGGQLYGKSKDYCVSQLHKFSRILSKDITESLRISFDALDKEDKCMFLDGACFFLGEAKSIAIEVWDGSGWSGLIGWETLLSKCLIEVDQQNRIRMHDHVRDMGRQIAMERPPYRLFPSSNLDIWGQERMVIRGIMETSSGRSHQWWCMPPLDHRPLFKELIELKPSIRGVQLLVAVNNVFSEEYATLSKELLWLRLFNFQQSRLPSWLSLENLRVLELYNAPFLEELWQDNMKVRNLSSLTKLSICNCKKLRSLPEPLALLKSIDINNTALKSLPKAFGSLTSLRTLSIRDSPIRELCFESESSSLPRLKSIHLAGTEMSTLSIPEDVCPSLESLILKDNKFLVEIRTLPRTVNTIILQICHSLKDIAGIGSLRNLQRLMIKWCPKLAEIPSFAEFASMKKIEIRNCESLVKVEGLEKPTSLETLIVHTEWEVAGITSLEQAQGLRRLRLSAGNIRALEPCIRTLQKWPGEVMIDVKGEKVCTTKSSLYETFTSANLTVVEGKRPYIDRMEARYPKSCLSHEATIVCFYLQNFEDYDDRWVTELTREEEVEEEKQEKEEEDDVEVTWNRMKEQDNRYMVDLYPNEGWLWIHVVSHASSHLESGWRMRLPDRAYPHLGNIVDVGLLATGEERDVKDAICRVLGTI